MLKAMLASRRLQNLKQQLCAAAASTFRAAECQKLGAPLIVTNKTREGLKEDEVRIRTNVCGLNYAAYLQTKGEYQVKIEPPFIPGAEIAGEVISVGKGVTKLSPGDVVVAFMEGGGLAEEIVVPEFMVEMGSLWKVDTKSRKDISYAKLGSVVVNYGTAWLALTRKGLIKEGNTVLVTGASGGVGMAAVELAAKVFNCQVVGVCRDEKSAEVLRAGASHTIDYTKQNIRKELRSIMPDGVNIVFDAVGGDSAIDLVKSLTFEGRFITIGYTAGIPKIPANLLLLKSSTAAGLWWGNYLLSAPKVFKESVQNVLDLYLNGKIDPYVQDVLPLDQVNDAFDKIASRKVIGKLLVSLK